MKYSCMAHVSYYEALAFARLLISLGEGVALDAFEAALLETMGGTVEGTVGGTGEGALDRSLNARPLGDRPLGARPLNGISPQKTLGDAFALIRMAIAQHKGFVK